MSTEKATDGGHLPPKTTITRWLVTTNHKDIGILYLIAALFFFIVGGTLALLMRIQLWTPRTVDTAFIEAISYNQSVSAHGLLMVFWFISPFAFGFANYVVPIQIGAEDLAFPRLNALSFWLYLASGLLFIISFFQGGTFAGGWTMYAPLNVPTYTPQIGATSAVLALILFVASVTISSVNFLTTMHRMRAEGMTLRKMPLFSSSILLTVWMMLFAFAALLAALLILASDRVVGTTYFQAGAGGSILWAHLFWFFGHPEVYIVFFPALGIMAETFQTFTGKRLVGRKWFVLAMVLVALQSFVVWMHHMFLTGINLQIKTLFMATTIGISLPFDLMVFALIYTMIKGRIQFTTPFLFSFGALLLFIIGGITGVFLGAIVLDYEFRGTYWVVAHFHYVMVGGATALFGGMYYWFPKMTGRMYDEFLGKVHFVMYFIGFNMLYFPLFIVWETPRRVFSYNEAFTSWHRVATIGAFILGASFLVMFYNLTKSMIAGEEAADNPWKYSRTLEWAIPSPPPLENFPGIPSYRSGKLSFLDAETAHSREAVSDGGLVTAGETLATRETDHVEGHEEGHDDHASWYPLYISIGLFITFLGLSGISAGEIEAWYYPYILVGGAGALGLAFYGSIKETFEVSEPTFAEQWPFANINNIKFGLWTFLASDVVLFGAFIGSFVFIRFAEGWHNWHHLIPAEHVALPGLVNTYLLLTSSFAVVLALSASHAGSRRGILAALVTTFVLGWAFLANKALEWIALMKLGPILQPGSGLDQFFAPIIAGVQSVMGVETVTAAANHGNFASGWGLSTNVASSTFYLTTGLHGAHVLVGLLIIGLMIPRAYKGAYDDNDQPLELFGLYWHFVDIVWLFLFPLFYIV